MLQPVWRLNFALELKFKQNDHLRKFLLSTNTRMLVTANRYDSFWGTGLPLNETRATESEGWPSIGTRLVDCCKTSG